MARLTRDASKDAQNQPPRCAGIRRAEGSGHHESRLPVADITPEGALSPAQGLAQCRHIHPTVTEHLLCAMHCLRAGDTAVNKVLALEEFTGGPRENTGK